MSISDEPDFEVTDLRSGDADAAGAERSRLVVLSQRARGPRRLIGGALSLAGIALLLAIILSSPGARATLVRGLNLPLPADQQPLEPGAGEVYLERGVPWGTLQIDDRVWALDSIDQPYTGHEGSYTVIRLARGRHHIVYTALPFTPLNCVVSVPAASGDTCPLITHPGPMDEVPVLRSARVMDLHATPERLTGSARAPLASAIMSTLVGWTPTADVAIGEPFLGAQGVTATSNRLLQASLSYTLVDNPVQSRAAPGTLSDCASICRLDTEAYLGDSRGYWPIVARVRARWVYTDADGHVVDTTDAGVPGSPLDGIVTLFARWNGAWEVAVPYFGLPNLTCDFALATLSTRPNPAPSTRSLQTTSGMDLADGCLVIEQDGSGRASSTRYFLYRFGIVLAVNAGAHRALPDLPVAGTDARAVARQLGARLT
jgi:hypothetical protein